jgi:serine/threonine protein kinase
LSDDDRSGLKPERKRLVCPCGAPVTYEPTPAGAESDEQDLPVQPKVLPCGACSRLLVVDDPNVGRVVGGKWRLLRRLGQGGMGTVYLALELSVDREVALKFLHRHLAEREEYRTRFEQEARVMARIEHPNLAGLYSVERAGGVPFLVMKFVPGQPLSRLMKEKKGLTLEETLPLTVQIAAALSALHARGYVHRDLKPGNVMVSDEGHVTLLDFGLTRTQDPNLTRPGVALGSPQYMSPEQVLAGSLDARSDLYALGVLTSELLVGRRPFPEEQGTAMLLQHLHGVPESPHLANSAVPESVSKVLLKALRKRPTDRQPSVAAFVEELVAAAKVGSVQLPRRETAEAMLAAVSRPPPAPTDSEVAEVISQETLSEPVSNAFAPMLTMRSLPELPPTLTDLPQVLASSDRPTDLFPVFNGKTEAMPARRMTGERIAPPRAGADAPRSTPEVDSPDEGVSWQMKLSLGGLLLVIALAVWVLLSNP